MTGVVLVAAPTTDMMTLVNFWGEWTKDGSVAKVGGGIHERASWQALVTMLVGDEVGGEAEAVGGESDPDPAGHEGWAGQPVSFGGPPRAQGRPPNGQSGSRGLDPP
jgi:hypothetical protein